MGQQFKNVYGGQVVPISFVVGFRRSTRFNEGSALQLGRNRNPPVWRSLEDVHSGRLSAARYPAVG